MIFTDTHTHLYSESFDDDQDEMIQRAIDAGVKRFFIPAIDSQYTKRMLDLKNAYPEQVQLMTGLHPTHVKENYQEELEHVKEQLETTNYIAIGEIGIDLYWDKSLLTHQQDAFDIQIKWAKQQNLPIAIHCRDAFDEVFEVLESNRGEGLRGIFHCFTGDKLQAQRAIDLNMKLGIGGVVTFKNGKIDKFLHEFDLSHIVLETDSPYLAPVPYRGKRNESGYLPLIAQKLASIYDVDIETIAKQTTLNSQQVFGL